MVLGVSLPTFALLHVLLYGKNLEGGWRRVFVIASAVTLYFNIFVLVVQLFSKFPLLITTAPTQKEPPFAATQLVVLAIMVVLGRAAVKGFRTGTPA